jgi:hypothetical protein
MPVPFAQPEGLTQEQAEMLRELNSFKQVSETAAWKKIQEKIAEMVEEAKEELLGCPPETTTEQRGVMSIRWQQREAMARGLSQFVDVQVREHSKLLEEIKEQHEHNSSDSGDPGNHDQ